VSARNGGGRPEGTGARRRGVCAQPLVVPLPDTAETPTQAKGDKPVSHVLDDISVLAGNGIGDKRARRPPAPPGGHADIRGPSGRFLVLPRTWKFADIGQGVNSVGAFE